VKPFHVYLYAPWGFARTGERQSFRISARTLDGNSVKGKGVLRIFRRALNQNGVPERIGSALKTIPFIPDDSHYPEFILNEEGVYEIDAEVISDEGISVSKSDSFFVIGEKQGKSLFGEYPLTVSTDKPSYQPGETARILVTCNTPGRTVYLTTRAERDAVIQQITMDGYSKLFTVPVGKGDQPNFYVSAVTVHNGKVYDVTSEIYVPPEKKMLNVSAVPAVEKVKPGTVLPVKIRVTDLQGNPVSGSVTAAVYDKSLEAVRSSSIAPVCPFFWSWRRWMPLGYFNNLHLSIPLEYTERIFYPNLASKYGIYFHRDIDGMKYRTRMSRGVYRKE